MMNVHERVVEMSQAIAVAATQVRDSHYESVRRALAVTHVKGGVVWFIGIGKSALLASRVAATWCSIGISARAEDATSMLHGGIGAISPYDTVFLLSKSGSTRECIELAEVLSGVVVLWVSLNPNCDVPVPIVHEADAHDLVPTNSLTMTGMILDAIGIEFVGDGHTREAFLRTHPGGTIGGR